MTIPTSSTSSSKRPGWRDAAAFGAFVVLLIAALNVAARLTDSPERVDAMRAKLESTPGRHMAVLGPSVGKAIFPEAMCVDGVNLAEHGLDVFEQRAIARAVVERGNVPRLWLMAVMPGVTLADNGSPAARRGEQRQLVYRVLHAIGDWRLIDGDWKTAARVEVFPALGYLDWKARANEVRRRMTGRRTVRSEPRYTSKRIASAGHDSRQAEIWARGRYDEFERVNYHDGQVRERAVASLLATARMIERGGGRMVLVYVPVSPAMQHEMRTTIANHGNAKRLMIAEARRAGLTVIDDTAHLRISGDLANFRDPIHLNYRGGLAYSRDLAERLARMGIIDRPDCPAPTPARSRN